ncbi:MAG TPA: dihydrofolate reductase family protein [Candidatus Saccharimonadales bacterium]|nr:dihydrofolate reductase family protein [Candidatus Saccharimonadales bacterium]
MRKLILQLMITLDGFIAGSNGELDWIDNDPAMGEAHFMLAQGADAAIIGHNVYRDMANYWPAAADNPHAPNNEAVFGKLMNEMKKLVLSTKEESLTWSNAEQVLGEDEDRLVQKVQQLKEQPGEYLLAYGGIQTAQTLVRHGLVDEYRLDVCPVALGSGKPLFSESTQLELVHVTPYPSGAMTVTYRPHTERSETTTAEQAPQEAVKAAEEPVEFGSWAKILVVEDNPAIAEVYKKRMELIGYICFVAHEGNEALAMIEKERPSLVLLDLMVPGVAGDQILKRMRASEWGKDIKVLVISNLSEANAPAGLRAQGIEGYAVKANLTDDQLDQMVNQIFERTGERPHTA